MNRQILAIGIAALAVVAVVVWFVLGRDTATDSLESSGSPPVPVTTPEERAEDARSIIASLQEAGSIDYDEAFERAAEFQRVGRVADAQMLYFFAARANHARSAFELASMNDPNHHDPATSLAAEPEPFQAYRWYTAARDQGMTAAATRLEELHDWAETAAAAGDSEADRLLLQWED
jgi:TPR repeat protein